MTISSTPMDLTISVLIGILTGLISGYLVTKFYRWKDAERDKAMYLGELDQYLLKLSVVIFDGALEISEEDIYRLLDFFVNNEMPNRYKWVKFSKEDFQEVEEIEAYIKNMRISVLQWQLNKVEKGKDEREQQSLQAYGEDIILKARMDFSRFNEMLLSLMEKYIHKQA